MKTTKIIPTFKDANEERLFWESHDATEYFDMTKSRAARFPNLKKTTRSISIRLPVDMIDALKVKANSMDVPYQSLIKMMLNEGLRA